MTFKIHLVAVCISSLPFTYSVGSNALPLQLSELRFKNSIMEGEILNKGNQTATEVWIHVTFQDSTKAIILEQDFRVIPGGDGKSIPKGWSKHFRYELKFNGATALTPTGFIKSVKFESTQSL